MRAETIILRNLIHNDDYTRKVLPHLKPDYFSDRNERTLYSIINDFVTTYNALPTKEALLLELDNAKLPEKDFAEAQAILDEVLVIDASNTLAWLLDQTEQFCKRTAVNNAILEAWEIIQGNVKKKDEHAIPSLLQEALAVSFDTRVGHDYIGDAPLQYDYYHRIEEKIPFDLDLLNTITCGGMSKKTLNIILGGTYVGKSLVMSHMAGTMFQAGYNVLYITLELSEEMVRERIDANILDIPTDMIRLLPRAKYDAKIKDIEANTKGKLIIKEYPTSTAGKLQFENLLAELEIKKNFTPDIIFVDYLNLCRSSRIKDGHSGGMYEYFKMVAEELRGIAGEYNLVMVTATQLNRSGFKASDFGMGDIAESFAVSMTGDFIIGLQVTDELKQLGQLQITQLKNRYQDINKDGNRKFLIGIDRPKMRLYNLEASAQDNIVVEQLVGTKTLNSFDKLSFDD